MKIAFTPFVDGQTLTAAALNTQQAQIAAAVNGGLDDSNVVPGGLSPSRLSAPNALFILTVPCSLYFDAFGGIGAAYSQTDLNNSRVGLNKSVCGSDVDFPVPVPLSCKVVAVSTSCHHLVGTDATATLLLNGSALSATETAFTDGAEETTDGLAVALSAGDTLKVRVHPPDGAGGGVSDPVVYLTCSATLTAAV